ncbi:hypothetical protein ACQJBY_057697 [Aegilops geniculata]
MASWNAGGATGIKSLEQFPAATAKALAKKGWLPDTKYLVILANQERYMPYLSKDLMPDDEEEMLSTEGPLFICPGDVHGGDNHAYPLRETVEVKVKGRVEMILTRSSSLTRERREYTLRGYSSYKLVHYGVPDRDTRKDVTTILAVNRLRTGVEGLSISADERKNKIAAAFSGAGSSAAAGGDDNDDYEAYFEEE